MVKANPSTGDFLTALYAVTHDEAWTHLSWFTPDMEFRGVKAFAVPGERLAKRDASCDFTHQHVATIVPDSGDRQEDGTLAIVE